MTSDEDNRSNNEYRDLIDSTGIAVLFLDRGLRINRFSRCAGDVFGLTGSDIGRPLTDIQSRLEYSDLRADANEVLASLQMVERDVKSSDGTAYLMQMTPFRSADDDVKGVVMVLIDITKRVEAEAEVQTAHSVVSEIVDNMTNAFFSVDREWKLTYANRRAEQMWGLSRDDVLGTAIWNVLPDLERSELLLKLKEVSDRPGEQKFEAFSTILNIWMEVRAHRASAGVSVYIRDITERKRREENLVFLAEINKDLAKE